MSVKRTEEPTTDPCAKCGKAAECGVWGFGVCYPCYRDWQDVVATDEFARRAHALPSVDERCALWTEATAKWARRRAEVAA